MSMASTMELRERLRAIGRTDGDATAHSFVENGVRVGGGVFHVFAGLCVVDNRENLSRTFRALSRLGVTTTRAGVWKPRTSPYDFQGLGAACLPWLFEEAGAHGIRLIAIEVMSERHIDELHEALERAGRPTGVLLQVGTRNAQNFELLKAVGRQALPVLYKRGMGNSLDEALLAAEYIQAQGNARVVFCLRGTRTHLADPHRNLVDFAHVPVVRRLTTLPVCVDPSHAVGGKGKGPDGVNDIHHAAAQGVVAGADMILVDVHPDPERALCDGPQALTLDELPAFLDDVHRVRALYEERAAPRSRPLLDGENADAALQRARDAIQSLDARLIELLRARARAGEDAAHAKRALSLPMKDPAREAAMNDERRRLARALGVDADVVQAVFDVVVAHSRGAQERLTQRASLDETGAASALAPLPPQTPEQKR